MAPCTSNSLTIGECPTAQATVSLRQRSSHTALPRTVIDLYYSNMTKSEQIAKDGSWKIVVEAFSVNWFVYRAMGVTTRVYTRGSPSIFERLFGGGAGWVASKAEFVSASGFLTARKAPGARTLIPGS